MNFSEITPINFELTEARTWGLKDSKFVGYTLPIMLDQETSDKIKLLAEEHKTKNPVYNGKGKTPGASTTSCGTLYLSLKGLTDKQRTELLDQGKNMVWVKFNVSKVLEKIEKEKTVRYLIFKVTKLRKIEEDLELAED